MKFKSWLAVSLLLFSQNLDQSQVDAFRFPADLNPEQKKLFINKVGKMEKRFESSKYLREQVKNYNQQTKKPMHGPIVQTHQNNFNRKEAGGLIRDSIYARYFNLQFEYQDAQDFVAGFSYQVFNDLFLYNAEDCTFWSFDTFSDMMNSFLLLVEDNKPDESILSFGYSVHKGPVAYYTCLPIISDYQMIVNVYTVAAQTPDQWGSLVVKIFWNIFFNWPDIYYEFRAFENEFEKRNWTMLGTSLAKMFTDIFFKAPIDEETWNYKNSDVVTDEWGEPPNLIQGLNDLWMWFGQESFLTEEQMQSNAERIRDADDLNFDDPEPQNVDIFDDDNGDNQNIIPVDDNTNDNDNSGGDDSSNPADDDEGGIVIINESKNPRVRSSRVSFEFNKLISDTLQEATDAPFASYIHVQMLHSEPDLLDEQTQKIQRLTQCVKTKGQKYKELQRQAKAIFKILDHIKHKHGYLQVEPLLDFTLKQYHCM